MTSRGYQRKHLRAPYKEEVLYTDGLYVQKGLAINISEGGLLLGEVPSFPKEDEMSLLLFLPVLPSLKNFSLLKMQTFSKDLFPGQVVRAKARMVRREELSRNLDNIFHARVGLEFTEMGAKEEKLIAEYVSTFASNLVYLQTLIDSYNTDEETRTKTRILAGILGYQENEKISQLRTLVGHDYRGLQWL